MVLGMFFLFISRVDIRFAEREFVWRTYTATEASPTTSRVEIINKKEFAAAVPNVDNETFVVDIAALAKPIALLIYPSYQAQVTLLTRNKTGFLAKYSDVSDIFSSNSTVELPEHFKINNHLIDLLDNKQLLYSLIYSLEPVKPETLKTYIEVNLASSFIRSSKSSTGA